MRQERGTPRSENHWPVPICCFRQLCGPRRLANHRTRHGRDGKAKRVLELLQHLLLETKCNGRVDDFYVVAGREQRGRDHQNHKAEGRFLTQETRKEEQNFSLSHVSGAHARRRASSTERSSIMREQAPHVVARM
jgi:hypothetical protein